MNANQRQVGGGHYRKGEVQHWDLMIQHGVPYTLGCATKYLFRWRDKNGLQDLEKAVHYLEKTRENLATIAGIWSTAKGDAVAIPDYVGLEEAAIVREALELRLDSALDLLTELIARERV